MKETITSQSRIMLFFLVSVFFILWTAQGDDALNRSIYIPLEIDLCDHLDHGVLYRSDDAIRSLPGAQIFQFTFYPSLHKLVPEMERLVVKAVRDDGKPYAIEIVVTSSSVYVGDKCMRLDLKRQMSRFRARVDVRYHPVKLKIACEECCRRSAPKRIADQGDH
jgi:hypothetical protein